MTESARKRGRPPVVGQVVREAFAKLDRTHDALLTALELHWRCSGSEAIRRCLRETAERTLGEG